MTAMMDWGTPKGVRRDYLDGRFGQVHYRIARPDNPTAVPLACFHPSPSSGWLYGRLLAEMGRERSSVGGACGPTGSTMALTVKQAVLGIFAVFGFG